MFLILLLALSNFSHAQDLAPASCGFAQTIESPRQFRKVQMVRRDERFGLHREGRLTLKKWIPIAEDASVGIDAKGRVFSVLHLSDRIVARLLSGTEEMTHLFLSPVGLFAINKKGEVLRFERTHWAESSAGKILKGQLGTWAFGTCILSAGALAVNLLNPTPMELPAEFLLESGFAAVSTGLISGYIGSLKFERDNETADGFRKTQLLLPNVRIDDFITLQDGTFDYQLSSEGRKLSLMEATRHLPRVENPSLHKTCEDELLPRGIPEIYEFN